MVKTCKGIVIMKKAIDESKVQRMRNLVSGDYTSKTKIRSGYTKKRIVRKEGDVWEENKKSWTIKNGIKQTINKLDAIRLKNSTPLCCPKCDKRMKNDYDKFAYSHFTFCMDCLVTFETRIKIKGRDSWFKYKQSVQDANFNSWLKEVKGEYEDFLDNRNSKNLISEAGDIEDWNTGQSNKDLKEKFNSEIKKVMERRNENN